MASAAAIAPIELTGPVHGAASKFSRSKLTAPDLERLALNAMSNGFLGILRHESLELGLGGLVLEEGRSGLRECQKAAAPRWGFLDGHCSDRILQLLERTVASERIARQ